MQEDIIRILGSTFSFCIGFFLATKTRTKTVISDRADGWLDIEKYPIDEESNLIVTDGKEVNTAYKVLFNNKGRAVFGWDKKVITKWMPLPKAPKD